MDTDTIQPRFGVIVGHRRQTLGLSRSDLAERLSSTSQYVSKVEGGGSAGLSALLKFARALNVLPSVLLSEALQEEWSGWWGPVLDGLEDSEPSAVLPSDYDLGVAAGYADALLDAGTALDQHVLAWSPDVTPCP